MKLSPFTTLLGEDHLLAEGLAKESQKAKKFDARPPVISLSPSAAERWATCTASPGYLLENAHRLPSTTTIWNTEGDKAHKVNESLLLQYKLPDFANAEMTRYGKGFVKFVNDLGKGRTGEWWSELKVKLWYMPARHGYVDFAKVIRKTFYVVDYKYGENVFVAAEKNVQMAIYARSAIEMNLSMYDIEDDDDIVMLIYQPRIRGDYPAFSEWKISWRDLKEMTTEELEVPARKIIADPFSSDLVFKPSKEACRWCPAKGFCKAKAKHDTAGVVDLFPLLEDGPVKKLKLTKFESLSPKQIATILEFRPSIKTWLDGMYKTAYAQGVEGGVPEGMKFIGGRNSRVWKDKDRAAEILEQYLEKEEIFTSEMISPSAADKKLKEHEVDHADKAAIETLMKSVPGRPTLVSANDKRQAVLVNPLDLFAELEEDDGQLVVA